MRSVFPQDLVNYVSLSDREKLLLQSAHVFCLTSMLRVFSRDSVDSEENVVETCLQLNRRLEALQALLAGDNPPNHIDVDVDPGFIMEGTTDKAFAVRETLAVVSPLSDPMRRTYLAINLLSRIYSFLGTLLSPPRYSYILESIHRRNITHIPSNSNYRKILNAVYPTYSKVYQKSHPWAWDLDWRLLLVNTVDTRSVHTQLFTLQSLLSRELQFISEKTQGSDFNVGFDLEFTELEKELRTRHGRALNPFCFPVRVNEWIGLFLVTFGLGSIFGTAWIFTS